MKKGRLEAFSDGVIAIIITIMVLELKVPTGIYGDDWRAILAMAPTFLTYALSFVYVGIYWNNHHHMFYLVDSITGAALWANLNLLFWLSLMPFATGWMGENHFSKWPVIGYGTVLIMCAVAYTILAYTLARHHRKDSALALALGRDWKGKGSLALYIIAVGVAFYKPYAALGIYAFVALIWFIPDRRMEKHIEHHTG